MKQQPAQGGEPATPPEPTADIWPDTEEVLQQMVSWLAGLEANVCQGRAPAEPAASRSRSYLSVHKVAALLAGEWPAAPLYLASCWNPSCTT